MHILGKSLSWFIVVLAIPAVLLTGQMFQVRNSWIKQVEELNKNYARVEKNLSENQSTLSKLQAQLQRGELGWGRYWYDVHVERNPAQLDLLSADVGTTQGLQQGMTVYAFGPNRAATSEFIFIGSFTVSQAQENRVALQPAWRVRLGSPHGPETWQLGPDWRLRELIPSAHKETLNDLDVALTLSDEEHAQKLVNLIKQDELIQASQMHLDLRLIELNGNPDLEAHRRVISQDMIIGLIKATKDQEEIRNHQQVDVDQLRRVLKTTNEEFDRLRAINERLAKSLPGRKLPITAKLPN